MANGGTRAVSLPSALNRVSTLRQRAASGEARAAIARNPGISRETLYRYLRQKQASDAVAWRNGSAREAGEGFSAFFFCYAFGLSSRFTGNRHEMSDYGAALPC
ncbi:hypothetical protein D1006_00215 [Burkholderia stabilis]|uniref:Resolvase HTH domain-containing protein n=1 Tax=Burkholderia stabilis TaxID=95485 RepID=A0A4Q2ALX4_9BURK|nr:hypothetical protein D1006_00215 [Burkholderia stabilis]